MLDETTVAVIEMEVSSEVRWIGFTVEPAIPPPLLIRQKPDRHKYFPSGVFTLDSRELQKL